MNNTEKGCFIGGLLIGIILMYSIFYFSFLYGITHLPFNFENIILNIDFNETEMIQAMVPYLNQTI